MKIIDVKSLTFPEVKVIRFARFKDNRGYFSEIYKKSEFEHNAKLDFLHNKVFVQTNTSYSQTHTVRGMHFQWQPNMDKLVRVINGKMIDLILDIRKGSPNFGKIIGYELSSTHDNESNEWIWIPQGFAHGTMYLTETFIEYMCTAEWSPKTEGSISPLASDIDWSLVEPEHHHVFQELKEDPKLLISDKDRDGFTVEQWRNNPNADQFIFTSLASSQ